MASRLFRKAAAGALDAPVAALAALAVGFALFAMPATLFEQAVVASGLPALLPAAAPPLGGTARLLASAVAVPLAFGAVYALLRLAGGSKRTPRAARPAEPEEMPVRRRRIDRHPDAPDRRPLFAASELAPPAPAAIRVEPAPEPLVLEPAMEDMPQAFPEPAAEEPAPEEEAPQPPADAAPPPPRDYRPESISVLMERLERGIAAREERMAAARPSGPVPAAADASPAPDPAGERLRAAMASLERLAARQR